MADFEAPRFPENISAGSRFGPAYSTSLARNFGGYEHGNQNWSMPLHEGDVANAVKDQDDLDDLLTFFHVSAGMFNRFRFKNWNDYTVTGSQGTVVQLSGTTWQMYKTRTFGAVSASMIITKPVSGATILGGGSYSTDTTTGIITALGSPTVVPTGWTGEFDFWVRFNVDRMLPESMSFELYDIGSIPIIEVRI